MGSSDTDDMARDDEKPQHQVTVSALCMAITPVTAGLYAEVMGKETPAAARAQLPVVYARQCLGMVLGLVRPICSPIASRPAWSI
jgi:formylglycine-generating enzyme required for sulfatase activity